MKDAGTIRDNRGIATSLLETALVIAIVAVISSIALVSAIAHIEDAKISRAMADAEIISVSIHSFMHDTGFAPAFKNGNAHGPEDGILPCLQHPDTCRLPTTRSIGPQRIATVICWKTNW